MAHDWIIGVLSDLAAYARRNGLDSTADASEALLKVASDEILRSRAPLDDGKTVPPRGRQH